jgi:hypothetical protein
MNENRCDKSGAVIWGDPIVTGDGREWVRCKSCGELVELLWSGRVAVHEAGERAA